MTRNAFFILLTLLCYTKVHAQYNTNENKVWAFGFSSGISFATGIPVPITTAMSAGEGCASVCDAAGNLLFYTMGNKVWNRLHMLMPSGTGFTTLSTGSTTQGAVIVPMPGSTGKYYLFYSGIYPGGPGDRLDYVIIDMALDGGLGDISTTGTTLVDTLSEAMVSVAGNSCNIWLITHRHATPVFLAYNITTTGISGPVISTCGALYGTGAYYFGVLKVSPDRHHIVSQSSWAGVSSAGTELYDFDPSTGIVSNCKLLDTTYDAYGAEFSPDNTKLYTSGNVIASGTYTVQVCQYDISLPTVAAITASRTLLTSVSPAGRRDLKLAVNNKIYVCNGYYLDCIANPNVAGTGCVYTVNAVGLGGASASSGMPNTVYVPVPNFAIVNDSVNQCISAGSGITLYPPSGVWTTYLWQDGTTLPFHYVTSSGTYWTEAGDGCNITVDSYYVHLDTLPIINLGNDTTISDGSVIILTAPHPTGSSCIWNTGSTTDTIHISTTGTYWVTLSTELCITSDTIKITVPNGVSTDVQHITKSIFPNPANEHISINVSGLSGNTATIRCYNAIGAIVSSQTVALQNGVLNTSTYVGSLPTCLYEIRIEDETGRKITERIMVNR